MQRFVLRIPRGAKFEVLETLFIGKRYNMLLSQRPKLKQASSMSERQNERSRPNLAWSVVPSHQAHQNSLLVLHGSNGGSTQTFAERVCKEARRLGFTATLDTLDSVAGKADRMANSSQP